MANLPLILFIYLYWLLEKKTENIHSDMLEKRDGMPCSKENEDRLGILKEKSKKENSRKKKSFPGVFASEKCTKNEKKKKVE